MKRIDSMFMLLVVLMAGVILGLPHPIILLAKDKQPMMTQASTKTIIGDLLDVDRDFYIVRGPHGEIQIEATGQTEITEEFGYGDRIRAIVLPNYKALLIERARPDEPSGVTENVEIPPPSTTPHSATSLTPNAPKEKKTPLFKPAVPETKTIVADLLDVDGDFYVVRGEHGEIRIEATPDTVMSETFTFGDRIKAEVTMTDEAISIERAGPGDQIGVIIHRSASAEPAGENDIPTQPSASLTPAAPTPSPNTPPAEAGTAPQVIDVPDTRIIEGPILMVDGDFYVLRGERGEIRVEVTPDTEVSEQFQFGDRIKATVLKNDKALKIERAP